LGDDHPDTQKIRRQMDEMKRAVADMQRSAPQARRPDNAAIQKAIAELRVQEQLATEKFGDRHPEVVALRGAIERLAQISDSRDNNPQPRRDGAPGRGPDSAPRGGAGGRGDGPGAGGPPRGGEPAPGGPGVGGGVGRGPGAAGGPPGSG